MALHGQGVAESYKSLQQKADQLARSEENTVLLTALKCHVRDINQAFFNILKNAIQAVAGEGEITIRTRQVGDKAIVSITDNGIGIDEGIQGRLFDPFFTTREVGAGAGLGLTQAY